ncbi:MAG: RecQ family ATP-dependent DNA helicase, partial [Candidatus Omnitrophica bacterium]|nr:RecQ family ATP-dependent DNA helicase [Candidatus Omnitrophota bacterium]
LNQCGAAAARIDSAQSRQERTLVYDRMEAGSLKLLYLSPERMFSNGFMDFIKKRTISFIAVDEAHCVSMWGHDFRPEYRQLGQLKQALPGVSLHAYTATATEQVRGDIAKQLKLEDPAILVGSFDRPNLIYKTERADNIIKQVCAILDRHPNESGVIYCIRRADVDEACSELSQRGYSVLPYHAGMDDESRKRNQDAFIQEKVNAIIATVAFGMGIDKSNVRYVIHTGMPKSLEHYQQESGRAGRDGLEAECCLFFSGADYGVWKSILRGTKGQARQAADQKLNDMYDYCTGVVCRHRALLRYFGQDLDKPNCAACDVCLDGLELAKDPLIIAQKILSCIVRLEQRFGADYTALVLTGSRDQRILSNGHDQLTTYNLLSEFDKRTVREWIEQLTSQGFLQKTGDYNVLTVTEAGWRIIRGKEAPRLLQPARKPAKVSKTARASWEGVDRDLFEILRDLRRSLAEQNHVPAFVVFSDAALRDMARRMPVTLEEFGEIHGVGESKIQMYGDEFTAVIQDYCEDSGIDLQTRKFSSTSLGEAPAKSSASSKPINTAKEQAYRLFAEGCSLEHAAASVDRKISTVYGYLFDYIIENKIIDSDPWVEPAIRDRIIDAAQQTAADKLKPIYEFLNGEVPYEVIRITLACLANKN